MHEITFYAKTLFLVLKHLHRKIKNKKKNKSKQDSVEQNLIKHGSLVIQI